MSEKKKMRRVFFDLDGVVFDFVAGFESVMGFPIPIGAKDLVESYELVDRDFFLRLPVIEDAVRLMYRLRDAGFEISILSSAGDYRHAEVVAHKIAALADAGLDWVEDVRFVEHSYEKALYAAEGILIDDREKSLLPFREAGGIAFYYEEGLGDSIFDSLVSL